MQTGEDKDKEGEGKDRGRKNKVVEAALQKHHGAKNEKATTTASGCILWAINTKELSYQQQHQENEVSPLTPLGRQSRISCEHCTITRRNHSLLPRQQSFRAAISTVPTNEHSGRKYVSHATLKTLVKL
ncbi:hypothetical protein, unlikely [Trypanosoma brucei gambiense DAL972]|uniref:Uncharacterized protein n=1 Tax=Trypanosoma brucei gambiense (strain MHOM/CI/86/DAL972) TaxID=679716 RepID=C9ZNY3_TRYB9|nr:hypothetical protein, unlikely [Trypanosoma brucei gambiense DAL972]CBH11111.1 hypothetical protein, unlikely [Trypanosoma brucei gambiense DAL972]|eukprot:XP_011773398.1 hypothetical protein, unlikely [Trypanosoma brucei gambiense DAL972]